MTDIMRECTLIQRDYATSVIAYLDVTPDVREAFMTSWACAQMNDKHDIDARRISSFGQYAVSIAQFLGFHTLGDGQWPLALLRVIRHYQGGEMIEQWERETYGL
jgi:hypothetical protein